MKFILLLSAIFSSAAFADQCQWNSKSDAASALKLLKGNEIILWCQNCGEAKPSYIVKVNSAKQKVPGEGFREITVETAKGPESIDLAYTYVRTASNVFTNMAQLVGCPSTGATTFIQTGPGVKKTAHFYDKQGQRVDVVSTMEQINIADMKMPTDRLPASTK
ncbi:MAG: hypothetical protein K2Q18_08130 [Bdellovibrionales bacterium]|nr:hypothetical protein [Bdellovibrionales bacterium]